MLKAAMYHRKPWTTQPGRKQTIARTAVAHGGSSTAAQKKKTRLGWNE
jgi:hypothetical protein